MATYGINLILMIFQPIMLNRKKCTGWLLYAFWRSQIRAICIGELLCLDSCGFKGKVNPDKTQAKWLKYTACIVMKVKGMAGIPILLEQSLENNQESQINSSLCILMKYSNNISIQ